jgi:hypothetical protein
VALANVRSFVRRGAEPIPGETTARESDREPLARALLADFLAEADSSTRHHPWQVRPSDFVAGKKLLAAGPSEQVAVLIAALKRLISLVDSQRHGAELRAIRALIPQLCRRRLPYAADDVLQLLALLASSDATWSTWIPVRSIIKSVEPWVSEIGCPPPIAAELRHLRTAGNAVSLHTDERKALALIDTMLADPEPDADLFDPADDWGYAAAEAFARLSDADRRAWRTLLAHAATEGGSKPTNQWRKRAEEWIEATGGERSREILTSCLGFVHAPTRPALDSPQLPSARRDVMGDIVPTSILTERNGDLLKGLAWCCVLFDDPATAAAVGDAAEACFKKIPNVGARSTKAGNACVYALGAMPGLRGAAQLQRLRQRVKQPSALTQIEHALGAASRRERMTRDDLDDLAVPTFGLVDGRRRERFGDVAAELIVAGSQQFDIQWSGPDGTPRKTEPAEIKRRFPGEVKEFKRLADDLRKMLPAQRDRLERCLLSERTWLLADWRQRYLEHPLLSLLARRLIWRFDTNGRRELGAWDDGAIVDVDDRTLNDLPAETRVRLWHPIAADAQTVAAWQSWLERHGVTQPFKQAHREVYFLTDAERATETFSNRFAGHILRQHQLQALCQARGWTYLLQGAWDGANYPTLSIPTRNTSVEFWVEGADADDEPLTPAGVFRYVRTDQVRFGGAERWRQPVPLTDVFPVIFSEVMRDVDLFVAVCSVGNDPTWGDRGPAWHGGYWHGFAFGDLSASALTRRLILERLLPRLKIAPRCSLYDRFLVVRGDLRTYKIHLGSGNVLMEPNNQYLCIVPVRGAAAGNPTQGLLLPFEGDGMLSVILSKAFLLAADTAITDPTITRQIRG